ncbi:MAG: glycosyltransferase family 4 protein [Flavobacteriales bacterium]
MKNKKKILILIDWYLPGTNAGGPVRSIHALVMHLRGEFDFYILTTNTDLGEIEPYPEIQPNEWVEREGYHVKYLSKERVNKQVLADEMCNPMYHRIYVNSLYSKWFSVVALRIAKKNKIGQKIILAPRGMLGKGAMAIKSIKKRVFVSIAKTLGWFNGITWHATSDHEKNDIYAKIGENAKVMVASNLSWIKVQEKVQKKKEPGRLNLFFLSRIARVKNLHLALEILKDMPAGNEITYDLYGPNEDSGYWEECQRIIETLPAHISVSYKGTVEHEKLPEVLKNYHALFMPTSNENFGHSIIESLANGCPVLISDQTPWRNLMNKKAGHDLPLNDKSKFAEVISEWTNFSQSDWNIWEEGALQLAHDFLNNTDAKKQYLKLFE